MRLRYEGHSVSTEGSDDLADAEERKVKLEIDDSVNAKLYAAIFHPSKVAHIHMPADRWHLAKVPGQFR